MLSELSRPRVVITGVGLVTPFGTDPGEIVRAASTGESATRWLSAAPSTDVQARGLFAGAPARYSNNPDVDPAIDMAICAADLAFADSGIKLPSVPSDRVGCVVGTSKGLLDTYADEFRRGWSDGLPGFRPNTPALQMASRFAMGGPCMCPVLACATGLQCVARGVDLIRDGHCDVVLAGSSDASICEWVLSSFNRLGVLARRFSDPTEAVRPFDEDREGFLVGEGAGMFVLERDEHAKSRSASVLARWLAGGSGADTTGMTQVDETGDPLAEVIRRTLRRAGVDPADIDYANLHGTATIPNDLTEARALRQVFNPLPPASSLKGAIGHLLGAAGSVELGIALLTMQTGRLPVTANTQSSILGLTREPASEPRVLLKTSLGFGGHLQAAVLECTPDRQL